MDPDQTFIFNAVEVRLASRIHFVVVLSLATRPLSLPESQLGGKRDATCAGSRADSIVQSLVTFMNGGSGFAGIQGVIHQEDFIYPRYNTPQKQHSKMLSPCMKPTGAAAAPQQLIRSISCMN